MSPARIIAVHGAKGGVGASVVAANLALAWAQGMRKPVALIDLDTHRGGCLAGMLNLEREDQPYLGLGNLADGQRFDLRAIREQMLHHALDVHLLAANPPQTEPLSPEQISQVLHQLSYGYEAVVVDAHQPVLSDELLTLFDYVSGVALVLTPDLVALHHTLAFLEDMHQLNYPPQKFFPVLNMAGMAELPTTADIEAALNMPLIGQIPYDPARAVAAVNRGLPLLQSHANPHISSAMRALADQLRRLPPTDVGKVVGHRQGTGGKKVRLRAQVPNGDSGRGDASLALVHRQPLGGMDPDERRALKQRIHRRLVEEIVLPATETLADARKREELKQQVREKVARLLDEEDVKLDSRSERTALIDEIVNEAVGLGPLEDLLDDPEITEIMVNGPYQVFVEQEGRLHLTDRQFMDEKQLRVVIDRIVAPLGRRVDESSPMVDARLPDGSRVNIVVPPVALNGATISIRKFPHKRLTIEELQLYGSISPAMSQFLQGAVRARLNIFISGGTSSGKTSTLNVLSSFIPEGERIITIEDAAELRLDQKHVLRLEARPPNIEGTGAVTIRDLVRNSLRQRPDRIIVGEVRGGEAYDMLQAMNTGHDGSLCTGHANSPRDALSRIENMVLMAGMDLPAKAIREQIASAIDLIVQQDRLEDGTRKVVKVTEVAGMEGDVITLQDIYVYDRRGLDPQGKVMGAFKPTGLRPLCLERFKSHGVPLPPEFEQYR